MRITKIITFFALVTTLEKFNFLKMFTYTLKGTAQFRYVRQIKGDYSGGVKRDVHYFFLLFLPVFQKTYKDVVRNALIEYIRNQHLEDLTLTAT